MIYRKEIDGLRALAVIPVLLFHAGFKVFEGGFVGVDIFFVISGYLITYIIIEQLSQKKFSLKKFYERRAKRILPALFLVMITSFPFVYFIMPPYQIVDFVESVLATSFFSSNFLFLFESGYFAGPSESKPLLHTWSLAVEEQFYLFYPLFLIFFWRNAKSIVISLLFIIFIISFLLSEYFSFYQSDVNFFMLPTRAWELLSGAFISFFLFYKYRSNILPKFKHSDILSIFGAVLVMVSIFSFDSSTRFPSAITLIPVIGTSLLIIFVVEGTILYKMFTNKIIVFFGLISYSLYLWHLPILVLGRIFFENQLNTLSVSLLLVISVLISYCSWKFFEVPLRRTDFKQKNVFYAVFTSMVFSVVLYSFTIAENGFFKQKNIYNIQYSLSDQHLSKYVRSAQEKIQNIDFPSNGKENVLIIGDSYSQDLINIISESNYNLDFNLSSVFIRVRCKNLNVEKDVLKELIKPIDYPKCLSYNHYFTKEVIDLINISDHIWLVSDWQQEDLPYLKKSLDNFEKYSNSNVLIFETKNLYKNRNSFYGLSKNEVNKYTFNYPDDELIVNNFIKEFNSVSIMDKYCVNNQCAISDKDGYLLSYDGSHLTKQGAIFISQKFNFNDLISKP